MKTLNVELAGLVCTPGEEETWTKGTDEGTVDGGRSSRIQGLSGEGKLSGVKPSGLPAECEGAVHKHVHPDPSGQAHVEAARTLPGRETKARAVIRIPRSIVESRFFFYINKIHISVF